MERENILWPFIVQNREAFLLESANRRSRFIRHLHVDFDQSIRRRRSLGRFGGTGLKLRLGWRLLLRVLTARWLVLPECGRERYKQGQQQPQPMTHADLPQVKIFLQSFKAVARKILQQSCLVDFTADAWKPPPQSPAARSQTRPRRRDRPTPPAVPWRKIEAIPDGNAPAKTPASAPTSTHSIPLKDPASSASAW